MPTRRAGTALVLILAAGCGGPAPPAPPPAVAAATATDAPDPTPAPAPAPTPAASAVAVYELDATRHTLPAAPATGRLDGVPFTPTAVTLTGNELTFAVSKPGEPVGVARSLTVKLPPAANGTPADGFRLVVRADEPDSPAVPGVETFSFAGDKPSGQAYVNGYALTLELDKRQGSGQAGRIAIALPDEPKSFLAGTFTAQVRRTPGEPPGPGEAPAVHGLLTLPADAAGDLEAGLIGAPAGQVISDSVTLPVAGPPGRFARTESARPTALALAAGGRFRYEHVKLEPGRYLAWARLTPGVLAWEWVTVAAGGVTDTPLTLDPKKAGAVAATTTQPSGTLRLVPRDGDAGPAVPEVALALTLKLEAPFDAAAKAFARVSPGRYDLVGTLKDGTEWDRRPAEVKPGETVNVKLK